MGMRLLAKKVYDMDKENKEMKKRLDDVNTKLKNALITPEQKQRMERDRLDQANATTIKVLGNINIQNIQNIYITDPATLKNMQIPPEMKEIKTIEFGGEDYNDTTQAILGERAQILKIINKDDKTFDPQKIIDMIAELVAHVHRNKNYPQMYNVFCPDYNSEDLIIYNADRWVPKPIKEMMKTMYRKIYDGLFPFKSSEDSLMVKKQLFELFEDNSNQIWKNGHRPLTRDEVRNLSGDVLKLLHMDKLEPTDKQILGINDILNIMLT
jgi:hypothetical protein